MPKNFGRFPTSLLLLLGILFFILSSNRFVFAGNFQEVFVRIDRMSASTPTTGLVCAKTPVSDNGTEATLSLTFPSGFIVSSTLAHWSVDTSNLPSGSIAWPGITTATSVSGQVVNFPSADLASDTLYCFRWTNSSALTTASDYNPISGSVVTKNSGNALIDSRSYNIGILTNDQLAVTATVEDHASDFVTSLASSTTGEPFSQDTEIDFTLTYGSLLIYPANLTLEAEWSLGTIAGASTPSVELLEYVSGSASDGYNGSTPVIDLVNRKIVWTLNAFPANTVDQTVTFKLKTTSAYTGNKLVTFHTSGRLIGQTAQSVDSTVTQTYLYLSSATPTPTPGPTNTPQPGPTATPTPSQTTSTIPKLTFKTIQLAQILTKAATIFEETSNKAKVTLLYGEAPNALNKSSIGLTHNNTHRITLDGLLPDTNYYFKLFAKDEFGQTRYSDVYLIKTPVFEQTSQIDKTSFIMVSNDVVLITGQDSNKYAIIPKNTAFTIRLTVKNSKALKDLKLFVRSSKVLGLYSAYAAELNDAESTPISLGNNNYKVTLRSPSTLGDYAVVARLNDSTGTISETTLFGLRAINNLRVYAKSDNSPVKNARVELSIYNENNRDYEPISSLIFPIPKYLYTNEVGELFIVLPQGSYEVKVSSPFFKTSYTRFTLSDSDSAELPSIYLESTHLDILNIVSYYLISNLDHLSELKDGLKLTFNNQPTYSFLYPFVIGAFIIICFITFKKKLRLPTHLIIPYFIHILSACDRYKILLTLKQFPHIPYDIEYGLISQISRMTFEIMLVTTIIFELVYLEMSGLSHALPFLILSFTNLIMWLLHEVHVQRECELSKHMGVRVQK